MAKLKARGRKELARVEKTTTTTDTDAATSWRRTTYALMSDNTILSKLDVEFKGDAFGPARRHSYGWKVWKRIKPGTTADTFVACLARSGYVQVSP